MSPAEVEAVVHSNLAKVTDQIAEACTTAGRSPDCVTLVGVSKYVDASTTSALAAAGCTTLGEARPQQLWDKAAAAELVDAGVTWRLIGHLQRNKADRTVAIAASIDSVDSLRLLKAINKAAESLDKRQRVLLEINISGDEEKHGFTPSELPNALAQLDTFPHVEARGLMGMAAREGGLTVARKNFAALRELRDATATPELPLDELSMGMSGDMAEAIAEGATHVRVGSALWAGLR